MWCPESCLKFYEEYRSYTHNVWSDAIFKATNNSIYAGHMETRRFYLQWFTIAWPKKKLIRTKTHLVINSRTHSLLSGRTNSALDRDDTQEVVWCFFADLAGALTYWRPTEPRLPETLMALMKFISLLLIYNNRLLLFYDSVAFSEPFNIC